MANALFSSSRIFLVYKESSCELKELRISVLKFSNKVLISILVTHVLAVDFIKLKGVSLGPFSDLQIPLK